MLSGSLVLPPCIIFAQPNLPVDIQGISGELKQNVEFMCLSHLVIFALGLKRPYKERGGMAGALSY